MFKRSFVEIVKSKGFVTILIVLCLLLLHLFVLIPGFYSFSMLLTILSFLISFLSILFFYFYIKHIYFIVDTFDSFAFDPNKEPETELDFKPIKKHSLTKNRIKSHL